MNRRTRAAVWACLLSLFLCLLSGCNDADAAAALAPTDRFFVNDFADVLTPEAENAIYSMGVQLQEKTKAQVVAVTVESLDGEALEDYSFELARQWGIGEKDKDTGVLLFLAVEERQVRIEVGSGLEGAITDIKSGRILDNYAVPSFKKDDFSTGMQQAYRAIVNEVYLEFGLEAEEGYVPADRLPAGEDEDDLSLGGIIGIAIVLLAVFLIVPRFPIWFHIGPFGHGGGRGGFGGGVGGGFGGSGGFGGGGGFSGGGGGFSGGGGSRGF